MYKRIGSMWQRRRNRYFRAVWKQRWRSSRRFRELMKQFIRNYIEEDGLLCRVLKAVRCERRNNYA